MRIAFALLAAGMASPAGAADLYLGLGKGLNEDLIQSGNIASSEVVELGLGLASPHYWSLLDPADLNLRLEIAAARLEGSHRGREQALNIAAIRPVLRWRADPSWFLELGLGYARLSDAQFEEIRMAGQDNFSVVAGAGWQPDPAGPWTLGLRYNHFSNGYTATPNPGLDYATATLAYTF